MDSPPGGPVVVVYSILAREAARDRMRSCCGWLTDQPSCSRGQAQADRLEELSSAVLTVPPSGRAGLIRGQPDTE
eukprot:5903246-Heterocapsa_arctica.AAC.1